MRVHPPLRDEVIHRSLWTTAFRTGQGASLGPVPMSLLQDQYRRRTREDDASGDTESSVFHVKPTAMFSSALTPVTVLLRLLHRWSDLSRTHVLHAFAHPTFFRCMINAVITSGSEHFISDERSSRSPSCAGEGGATALVSRETNRQPCRRETLKFARHTCSFPRTPTCFLREQRSSWATGTGTTVMHCGRHPYSRHTLRVQEPMKQRRAEKYRKSFVRTPIPPARPRRRRRLRSGEARNVTIPLEQSGIAFRVSRETRSRSQHHTSCRAHGAWSVCRCTTGERIGVLLEGGSLLPHIRSLRFAPGIPIQRHSL